MRALAISKRVGPSGLDLFGAMPDAVISIIAPTVEKGQLIFELDSKLHPDYRHVGKFLACQLRHAAFRTLRTVQRAFSALLRIAHI